MIGEPVLDDAQRFEMVRGLGESFDRYRTQLATGSAFTEMALSDDELAELLRVARRHLDDSLEAAHRPDGLYDAYNLIDIRPAGDDGTMTAGVSRLAPMLEGQVAAIGSGTLGIDQVADLVERMYESDLYRPDVDSFLLYPALTRPSFLTRNQLPVDAVAANPLLTALLDAGDEAIVTRDVLGQVHFHADFTNAADLEAALIRLERTDVGDLVEHHRGEVHQLFEDVFHHHAFTGRSSTMYAYEGIGSIYWHMVAKLLLAVQETLLHAADDTRDESFDRLERLYRRVRVGLGFNKTPTDYGAFPTDPYSHTPAHAGAQQPGMTGQVKEELLTRWAELGVTVRQGSIRFTTALLDPSEFRTEPGELDSISIDGTEHRSPVKRGAVGLTVCRVPVMIHADDTAEKIIVTGADGLAREHAGLELDPATSRQIFLHTGEVRRLDVHLPLRPRIES